MVRRVSTAPLLLAALALSGLCGAAATATAAPRAVDFEQDVTTASSRPTQSISAASGAPGTITLRPRRGFDLVGFKWSGAGAPHIDVRSYGARGWSRWTHVPTESEDRPDDGIFGIERDAVSGSSPVWTGRSSRLQLRVEGSRFGSLRAHYVRIPRAAAAGSGARAAGTGGVAPGDPAPTASKPPNGRSADVPAAPPIVTRGQWGADRSCKPRVSPAYGEVGAAVVHHTVSTNSYSRSEAASVVLGVCRYHRNSNGWNDIGYNILIDRFGTIYEGRGGGVDRAVIGAHAQGYNGQTAGISLVGTFTSAAPPQAMLDSLQTVLKWKLALAGITRNERVPLISTGGAMNRFKNGRTVFARVISGHRDLGSTACPGATAYPRLTGMASFLDQNQRQAVRMSMRIKRVTASDGGHSVIVSGRLRAGGAAVDGGQVEIQAFNASVGWEKIADATSNANGVWQATVRPASRVFVRGYFAGSDTRRVGRTTWQLTPKLKKPNAPAGSRR